MRSPEFFKELGVTALGQILPPGAYSIWAIWQSTYERKTIRYQLTALKALAELNSSEITPEGLERKLNVNLENLEVYMSGT
ncbi:hypothetical protein ACXEO8_01630 [Cytobacillus firmus]|uniref:hypothetical protein n=1 Tax=Cytobacillus firmus TaxID=1399 RepID=UPI0021C7E1F4|nr:hypothetical protein [Cytobacillus firmus]MCU1808746.1 hypothetical protein [Cytobacillus firmus]